MVDLVLHLQIKVHSQYKNGPDLTIFVHCLNKKSCIYSSQYFFLKKKRYVAKYAFVPITWKNMHIFWGKKNKTECIMYGYLP